MATPVSQGGVELSLLSRDAGYALVEGGHSQPDYLGYHQPRSAEKRKYYVVLAIVVVVVVVLIRPLVWTKEAPSSSSTSNSPSSHKGGTDSSPNDSDNHKLLEETYKIIAPDGATMDMFGMSMAFHGNTLVIGAPYADDNGLRDNGRVYVYTRSSTNQQFTLLQELAAANPTNKAYFGSAVAVWGDIIAVGAPYTDLDQNVTQSGSVSIFTLQQGDNNQYVQTHFLTANDGQTKDYFGWGLAMNDDTLVVGAPFDDNGGEDQGSVYVFRFDDSWSQVQVLTADDATDGDNFGSQMAILEDSSTIVIGVWEDSDKGENAGSVYVFEQERQSGLYQQTQQLYAKDGQPGDGFGVSVSMTPDTLVVGANYKERDLPGMTGSAYIFKRSGEIWQESQILRASDATGDAGMFGECVYISERRIVVGDSEVSFPGSGESGHAYVFDFDGTTWKQSVKLHPSDPSEDHRFGRFVDMSGDTVVVTAFFDGDSSRERSGSAYVYEL